LFRKNDQVFNLDPRAILDAEGLERNHVFKHGEWLVVAALDGKVRDTCRQRVGTIGFQSVTRSTRYAGTRKGEDSKFV
jgi:hypothetical protein